MDMQYREHSILNYRELYRKFGHQEVLFAPLLKQLNTVIKLLNISSHTDHNNII